MEAFGTKQSRKEKRPWDEKTHEYIAFYQPLFWMISLLPVPCWMECMLGTTDSGTHHISASLGEPLNYRGGMKTMSFTPADSLQDK